MLSGRCGGSTDEFCCFPRLGLLLPACEATSTLRRRLLTLPMHSALNNAGYLEKPTVDLRTLANTYVLQQSRMCFRWTPSDLAISKRVRNRAIRRSQYSQSVRVRNLSGSYLN